MWGLNGIEHIELDHGYFFHGEETTHDSIAISANISGENHPFVEHVKFVKQFEDDTTVARHTGRLFQTFIMLDAEIYSLITILGECSVIITTEVSEKM